MVRIRPYIAILMMAGAGGLSAASIAHVEATCRDGVPSACEEAGIRYATGDRARIDGPKAVRYLDRACTLGSAGACNTLAFIYADAEAGIAQSYTMALRYWRKACRLGDPTGCANYRLALSKLKKAGFSSKRDGKSPSASSRNSALKALSPR